MAAGLIAVCIALGVLPFVGDKLVLLGACLYLAMSTGPQSRLRQFMIGLSTVALFALALVIEAHLMAIAFGAWLQWRSGYARPSHQALLRRCGVAAVLFALLDLVVLDDGRVLYVADGCFHWITGLTRTAFGDGPVLGSTQMHLRYIVLCLCWVFSFTVRPMQRVLLPGIFACATVPAVCLYNFIGDAGFIVCIGSAAMALAVVGSRSQSDSIAHEPRPVRFSTISARLTIVGMAMLLIVAVSRRHAAESAWRGHAQDPLSVLFIDDHLDAEGEGGSSDMTAFAMPKPLSELDKAAAESTTPEYSMLAHRLLPALGYEVRVAPLADIAPEDYSDYDVIALISLQRALSEEQRSAIMAAVEAGHSNVLVAADHTDIHGVQGPFNALMDGCGIHLNYDSVFPFGQWRTQLDFCRHELNGRHSLLSESCGPESGYSVGASLTITDPRVRPVLRAADGFADLGTPAAPIFAGLGDMTYSLNECRGGQVLAAECPLGKGTLMAFGDTAFLQNTSVARNFPYIASLFEYLACSRNQQTLSACNLLCLPLAGCAICGSLIVHSVRFLSASIVIYLLTVVQGSFLLSEQKVAERLTDRCVVVDNSHAEIVEQHSQTHEITGLINALQRSGEFVVVGDAWQFMRLQKASSVILLAPRQRASIAEGDALLAFIKSGGTLLYAAGYFEASSQAEWLRRVGAEIAPLPLGGGQQVSLANQELRYAPALREAWKINADDRWKSIVTCFDHPAVAERALGSGRIAVVADSFVLLDSGMQNESLPIPENHKFVSSLFANLQRQTSSSAGLTDASSEVSTSFADVRSEQQAP